ncbi:MULTISPECIES: DUF4190 domain-containing protein [unclassified Microbacterium]|uniref:DUF4190 domain-containing protein n=1 Tax=unclassified Microbacterium TaxID=2609290 RepID=UPI00203BA8DE|nr:DUF4190 domain-containing protein [Microbacterium sp. USTB-Y]
MSNDNGGYPPPGQQPPAYPGAPVPPQQPAYPGAAPQQQQPTPGYPGAAPQQPAPVYPGATPPAQAYPGAAPTTQGYPGASYAPPYGQPYPAPLKSNGLAITALICGIAGVVLFWLAYIVLPFLAAVTAIITGHMALGRVKRDPALGGKGIALTGVILGYVGAGLNLIIGIGFLMLIVYGISQGANSGY